MNRFKSRYKLKINNTTIDMVVAYENNANKVGI